MKSEAMYHRLNITEGNLKIKTLVFLPIIEIVLFQLDSRFEVLKKLMTIYIFYIHLY
jgi:hypothetical protein